MGSHLVSHFMEYCQGLAVCWKIFFSRRKMFSIPTSGVYHGSIVSHSRRWRLFVGLNLLMANLNREVFCIQEWTNRIYQGLAKLVHVWESFSAILGDARIPPWSDEVCERNAKQDLTWCLSVYSRSLGARRVLPQYRRLCGRTSIHLHKNSSEFPYFKLSMCTWAGKY